MAEALAQYEFPARRFSEILEERIAHYCAITGMTREATIESAAYEARRRGTYALTEEEISSFLIDFNC